MKRKCDKQEIAHLLDKFMAGETSLDEEKILADYFRTHEVSTEWWEYKEMFALFDSGAVDIEPEEETNQQAGIIDTKVRKLPKTVIEKPKIIHIRWLMTGIAASVLFLIGFSLFTKDGETKKSYLTVARVSKQTDLKPTTKEPHATFEEPQEQEQSKKVGNHKHRTINKPKESPVQFMTDEMVDQLLARNHQIAAIQPTTDSKEIENEIRRHGEELTNDLLAFTTNK